MRTGIRRRSVAAVAVTIGALLAAGCGASTTRPAARAAARPVPAAEREWVANASGVIDQLRGDVELSRNAGGSIPAARHALRDESDLFALLLAYTDFGGCRAMLASAGSPGSRFAVVERRLALACAYLQLASALFTRSTARSDPVALVAASREVAKAAPLLYTARFELAAREARH